MLQIYLIKTEWLDFSIYLITKMINVTLSIQIIYLFLLAIPIACIAWTVTHEEIFKEPREYCIQRSKNATSLIQRKFFYVFTCEYCFSHYVTAAILIFTRYHLLFDNWKGYVIAEFSLVWIANLYMSLFSLLRQDIKKEKIEIEEKEKTIADK
jgi:hypothetical protein